MEILVNKFLNLVRFDDELKDKLMQIKTFDVLTKFVQNCGFNLTEFELLHHQAQNILTADDGVAELVANHTVCLSGMDR